MREQLDRLLTRYESGCMTRRELLGTIATLMMIPSVATASEPAIGPVKQLNHVTLFVQDVQKSVNFYQELFGMPILTPQPPGFNLKAGTGFVGVYPADGRPTGINHFCLTLDDFDACAARCACMQRFLGGWSADLPLNRIDFRWGSGLTFNSLVLDQYPPAGGLGHRFSDLTEVSAMNVSVAGLRVLITAGANGIGRTFASTFFNVDAKVFVCDVDSAALAQFHAVYPGIGVTATDVAAPDQVDAMFEAVVAGLGGIDVLINNAGIAGPTAKIEDISIADWDRTISVDLNSMFYCTRRAVPLLKAESLAMELGPSNICVNAILPGAVEGERADRVISAKAKALGVSFDEVRERFVSPISMRRMVTAQDIADMALFLAAPSGRNISGQALSVCGDHATLA